MNNVTVRLPSELVGRLEAYAKRQGRSVSYVMRELLGAVGKLKTCGTCKGAGVVSR